MPNLDDDNLELEGLVLYDPFSDAETEEAPALEGYVEYDPNAYEPPALEGYSEYSPISDISSSFAINDTNEIPFELELEPEPIFELDDEFTPSATPKKEEAYDSRFDDIEVPSFDEPLDKSTKEDYLNSIEAPALDDEFTFKNSVSSKEDYLNSIEDIVFEDAPSAVAATPIAADELEEIDDVVFDEGPANIEVKKNSLDDIDAPELAVEDAPPKTEYKPAFVDPDLEKAKKDAVKNAHKASLAKDIDPSKKLDSMKAWRREQELEKIKKGGKKCGLLLFFGIIASLAIYFYSAETFVFLSFKPENPAPPKITPFLTYGAIASAIMSFLIIIPQKFIKGLASFVFFIMSLATLGAGGFLLSAKLQVAPSAGVLAAALFFYIFTFATLQGEDVEFYYKGKSNYD